MRFFINGQESAMEMIKKASENDMSSYMEPIIAELLQHVINHGGYILVVKTVRALGQAFGTKYDLLRAAKALCDEYTFDNGNGYSDTVTDLQKDVSRLTDELEECNNILIQTNDNFKSMEDDYRAALSSCKAELEVSNRKLKALQEYLGI